MARGRVRRDRHRRHDSRRRHRKLDRMISALLLAAAVSVPPRPADPCTNIKNPPLCRDLIEMYDRDQAVRQKWIADPKKPALIREMESVDKANLARVKAILNQFGWPGKNLV